MTTLLFCYENKYLVNREKVLGIIFCLKKLEIKSLSHTYLLIKITIIFDRVGT